MEKKILSVLTIIAAIQVMQASEAWDASLNPWTGIQLKNASGELCAHSRLIAVDPPWKQVRFFTQKSPLESLRRKDGDKTVSRLFSRDKTTEIYLENYSLTAGENQWTVDVDLRQNGTAPTKVEYTALVIPEASLLTGKDIRWKDSADVEHFHRYSYAPVPRFNFISLDLPTVFGIFTVKVNQGLPLDCIDRRIDTFSGKKCFWIGIGISNGSFSKAKPFRHRISVSFRPYKKNLSGVVLFNESADAKAKFITVNPLNRHVSPVHFCLPVPKNCMDDPAENFVPGHTVTVRYDPIFTSRLWKAVARGLKKLNIVAVPENADAAITVKNNLALNGHDAYKLTVAKQGVVIEAASERGAFYGLQTLVQRFNGKEFAGGRIVDSADFAIRGLHIIPDCDSLKTHGEMIENLLAPLKINHLIMEVGYVKWDATKGFQHPMGMSKKDLAELLKIAYENYIDVTPLTPSFGHCHWLFHNGKNLDLADNPARPIDYNVHNPRTYQLMRQLLDEVLTIFKPKYLHIGHDEIEKIAYRSQKHEKETEKILRDDLQWYIDYAEKHGIKLMMWHDMVMNKLECAGLDNSDGIPAVRKTLPRNITICYWEYSDRKTWPAVELLQKEGFTVWPVGWFWPNTVENFATYCKSRKTPAFFGSTWAGYFGTKTVYAREYAQISAYLRVAAWGWNANPAVNHHDYDRILFDVMKLDGEQPEFFPGEMLELSNFAVLPLNQKIDPFGTGHLYGLDHLPDQPFFCGDIQFQIVSRNGKNAALTLLSSRFPGAPDSIVIPFAKKVKELYFLHFIPVEASKDVRIADYIITYDDGTRIRVPIRYGREIQSPAGIFNLLFNHHNSYPLNWPGGKGKISYFKWKNPRENQTIKSVSLANGNFGHPLYLLGISLR